MKRYLLFSYDHNYALGGWKDFIAAYDTIEEAVEKSLIGNRYHVVDSTTGKIVIQDGEKV